MILLFLTLAMNLPVYAVNKTTLMKLADKNPFSYPLDITVIPGKKASSEVTICCHGYGHNKRIVNVLASYDVIPGTLIGFNFPDYNINPDGDHSKTTLGTINEILPLLYILKRCVCDIPLSSVNLYGFSAGGGAIVNALAELNQFRYVKELKSIGIDEAARIQIIRALEKGLVILDCPLKSIEEVIALRGSTSQLKTLAAQYAKHGMRPIDSIGSLQGLKVQILLYFENPDEVIGNRDDALFIEKLKKISSIKLSVSEGTVGGHSTYHTALWDLYKTIK